MKNKFNLLFLLIFIIYFFPYLYLGEDFTLDVFDNMDSSISWVKLGIENFHLLLNPTKKIESLLGGASSFASVYPNLNIPTLFYWLVGYYWGFVICKMTMVIIGYRGMTLLLSKVFIINNQWLVWGLSISFSIIPFWGDALHIVGIPLLAFCLHNIYMNKSNRTDWLFVLIFPFYSSLVLVGLFILLINGCILLVSLINTKKINKLFLKSNIVLGVFYLLSHYPLIMSFIGSNKFISHRIDMNLVSFSFEDTFRFLSAIIIRGDFAYHGDKPYFNVLYILPILIGFFQMYKNNVRKRLVTLLILFSLVIGFLVFFLYWKLINDLYYSIYAIIPITWDRVLWWLPVFWIVSAAIVFDYWMAKSEKMKYVSFIIVLSQTIIIASNHKLIFNHDGPSFAEFYSVNEFEKISQIIGKEKNSYRLMNIGLHPAVAHFNGFYTIDGFSVNYPLEYKLKYETIIRNELAKKRAVGISTQFYNWGSWCYSFSEEVGFNLDNNFVTQINDIDYDWKMAESLGADFVLSTGSIQLNNLKLITHIEKNATNYYPLYLYEIIN